MPRLTKIYTRKGDRGETSLGSRTRVSKNSARIQAYGEVDELNAFIGLAITNGLCARLMEALPPIQNQLFHLGSDLAFPEDEKGEIEVPRVEKRHVDGLEVLIDELNDAVGPLENFILPGGTPGAAALHCARTVCRRAERRVVALMQQESISEHTLSYLNRLSDALFVLARYENHDKGVKEPLWDSHA
jgi:cob(I)alamin adenosyltransferase